MCFVSLLANTGKKGLIVLDFIYSNFVCLLKKINMHRKKKKKNITNFLLLTSNSFILFIKLNVHVIDLTS